MKIIQLLQRWFLALIAALVIQTSHADSALPDGVDVSISVSRTEFGATDRLWLNITYRNISAHPVRLLKWSTALGGGLTEDLVLVEFNGEELSYIGIHAKRLAPTKQDYITLLPDEHVSQKIDLLRSYPINSKGSYQISMRDQGALSQKERAPLTIRLTANRVIPQAKRPANFQNCDASQISSTDSALGSAERIANRAARDLRNAPVSQRPSSPRYLEWFGSYSSGRYASVQRGMSRIASAITNQTIGFNCDCEGVPGINSANTFAFVFKNDPYNMTLCGVFFQVPRDGTDSKSGTIVHEISHFTVVADSDDFPSALDQAGSRSLARSSPANAILNANGFEYFAENTPFLLMLEEIEPEPDPEPEPESKPSFLSALYQLLLGHD